MVLLCVTAHLANCSATHTQTHTCNNNNCLQECSELEQLWKGRQSSQFCTHGCAYTDVCACMQSDSNLHVRVHARYVRVLAPRQMCARMHLTFCIELWSMPNRTVSATWFTRLTTNSSYIMSTF